VAPATHSEQLEFLPAQFKVLQHHRIKMLEPGQCRNCKFWTYVGDDANPFVVYEFSLTREGGNPTRFLEGFKGYLQADAFSGYDELLSQGTIIEVACMAGHRRGSVGRPALLVGSDRQRFAAGSRSDQLHRATVRTGSAL
jgi:hypothetical protein